MRYFLYAVVSLLIFCGSGVSQVVPPTFKATTNRVWRPTQDGVGGHFVHFVDRNKMKSVSAVGNAFTPLSIQVTLPIDWAKSIDFPMDLNDTYGDCYYAAGCHADNTWAGNVGLKSVFSLAAIKTRYFALSGGDNGLGDSDMQGEMKNRYLADVPAAKIIDYMTIDTTNTTAVQQAMWAFGVVMFTFAVPDAWINNSETAAVWDAPARANQNNGHAVIWNGCDAQGKYKLQTWGSYVWITPAGVKTCDPAGWVAFSTRWFKADGYAPNGLHITQVASLWAAGGGKKIPASVISAFPPPTPTPPNPPNPPNPPIPVGSKTITLSGFGSADGTYPVVNPKDLQDLKNAFEKVFVPQDQSMKKKTRTQTEELEPSEYRWTNSSDGKIGCSVINVHLPAEASLTVDGFKSKSTGDRRSFVTPAWLLDPGFSYYYVFRAELNGVVQTRRVEFKRGEECKVEFDFAANDSARSIRSLR